MRFVPRRLTRTADVSRGDTSWQSFAKNAISVVIVFVAGYLALGAVSELMARTIPDRWEARAFGGTAEWSSEFDEIGTGSPEEIARVDAVLNVDQGVALAESGYSRAQETEADAFGLRLVFDVYGETEGSLEFFEMFQEFESDDAEPRWAAFLQSHPLTEKRLGALRELRTALEEGR